MNVASCCLFIQSTGVSVMKMIMGALIVLALTGCSAGVQVAGYNDYSNYDSYYGTNLNFGLHH